MDTIKYDVKLRNPSAHKQTLAVAHGILAAAEQLGCAHRTMTRYFRSAKRPGDKAVIWFQFFSAAGAVGELRARLMRYKPCEFAAREHLAKVKPKLVPVLDRLVARQVRGDLALQMCCYAQIHYWSHWNEHVSTDFIDSLKFDGSDPPIIATADDQRGSSSGSPWIKEAWRGGWKREFKITEAKLRVVMNEINVLCRDAAKMGRYAALGIVLSTGATLERTEGVRPEVEPAPADPEVVVTRKRKHIRLSAQPQRHSS